MKNGISCGFIKSLLSVLTLCWSLNATAATAFVDVSYLNLSPNPVNIEAGDAVYWTGDEDPDFPYIISGPWGNVITPGGVTFPVQGTYNYTASWTLGGGSFNGTVIVSPGVPNQLPVVTITNPTNNAVFAAPASFAFTAEASDPDPNDVWDVEFWVNDEMVDDVYNPPYATTVTDLPVGTYTLMAIVWDFSFETATNSITITVTDSTPITPVALTATALIGDDFAFNATGLVAGKTNVLQTSTNLASPQNWVSLSTNVASSTLSLFTNKVAAGQHFFRVLQLP
jgi:hypothetical protein